MTAEFNRNGGQMSLTMDYDSSSAEDQAEAARLVEAYFKASETKPQTGAALSMLTLAAFCGVGGGRKSSEDVADGIQTAIKSTDGKTPYDRGFRNALRYAQWLVDGTVPQYEGPTLGNDGGGDGIAAAPERAEIKDMESYRLGYMEAINKINGYILHMGEAVQ